MCLEWRILACHPERPLIHTASPCHSERQRKNLVPNARSFADAQNDIGEPNSLFLSDELMEQYVGINEFMMLSTHQLEVCSGYISKIGRNLN